MSKLISIINYLINGRINYSKNVVKFLIKLILKNGNEADKQNLYTIILKSVFCYTEISSALVNSLEYKLSHQLNEIISVINPYRPYTFINYLKTGSTEKIDDFIGDDIDLSQFIEIRTKDINRIIIELNKLPKISSWNKRNEQLKEDPYWRLFGSLYKEDAEKANNIKVAYKLYLILGLELSLELISGYYGEIDLLTIYIMFYRCIVDKIEINDGRPVLDDDLIKFLTNSKKSPNNILRRIINGDILELLIRFNELYYNIDKIKDLSGDKLKLSNVTEILKDTLLPPQPVKNEFSSILNRDIINSAKKFVGDDRFSDEELINDAQDYYYSYLYNKTNSSIPRVSGTYKDFAYEIIKLDDPVALILGYLTGNCFRINGDGKSFLDYYAKTNNMRILIIKDKLDGIIGMVPIIRNGSAIVGNSIEISKEHENFERREMMYNAIKKAFEEIIDISKKNERMPLNVALIADRKQRVGYYSNQIFWGQINPIYEGEYFINNFSETQYIVASDVDYYERGYREFVPEAVYQDERPSIISEDGNGYTYAEIEKRVNNIIGKSENPCSFVKKRIFDGDVYTVCSTDWFVSITSSMSIRSLYLNRDPRAKEECENYITILSNHIRNNTGISNVTVDVEKVDISNMKLIRKQLIN